MQNYDDTSIPEVQVDVPDVQVVQPKKARVEEAADKDKKEDVEREEENKTENPPINEGNPMIPDQKESTEKVEPKKVDVKVEVETKARDTAEATNGKKTMDDLEFIQGPINIASLSPTQNLQLASFA